MSSPIYPVKGIYMQKGYSPEEYRSHTPSSPTKGIKASCLDDAFERSSMSGLTPVAGNVSFRSASIASVEQLVEGSREPVKITPQIKREIQALDVLNLERDAELIESTRAFKCSKEGLSPVSRPESSPSSSKATRSSAMSGFRETPVSPSVERLARRRTQREEALKAIEVSCSAVPPRGDLSRATYELELEINQAQRAATPLNIQMFEDLMINYVKLRKRAKAVEIFHQIPSNMRTLNMCTIALEYYSKEEVSLEAALSVCNFKTNLLRDPFVDFHWGKILQEKGIGFLKESEAAYAVPSSFALLVIQNHNRKIFHVITGHRSGSNLRREIMQSSEALGYQYYEDPDNLGVLKIKK